MRYVILFKCMKDMIIGGDLALGEKFSRRIPKIRKTFRKGVIFSYGMWTSTRGVRLMWTHVDRRGDLKHDFRLHVINGWLPIQKFLEPNFRMTFLGQHFVYFFIQHCR